jgi:hypothetical protein
MPDVALRGEYRSAVLYAGQVLSTGARFAAACRRDAHLACVRVGGEGGNEMLTRVCAGVALLCLMAACGSSSSKKIGTASVTTTTTTTIRAGGVPPTTTVEGSATTPSTGTNAVNFNMHANGTINGIDFDGPIAGSELRCTPSGDGNYVQVIWAGTIAVKGQDEQISGDMNLKIGSTVFPSGGQASMVLGGDYQHRIGATSGTADAKSGTINAKYSAGSDTGALQGTWHCT